MQITLEGESLVVPVERGQTVLHALLRAGVPFPFSCQSGTCGTCKCRLVRGEVAQLPSSERTLTEQEKQAGTILACRSQVLADTVIRRILERS